MVSLSRGQPGRHPEYALIVLPPPGRANNPGPVPALTRHGARQLDRARTGMRRISAQQAPDHSMWPVLEILLAPKLRPDRRLRAIGWLNAESPTARRSIVP